MLFKIMSQLAFYCGAGLLCLVNGNAFSGQTTRVSVSSNGKQVTTSPLKYIIETPSINADGRYVAFISDAPNLVADDTNNVRDVFVHDRLRHKTERVSIASNGVQANSWSLNPPSISADGRYVAFESYASNLVAEDTNNHSDIFLHDRQLHKTTLVSIAVPKTQRLENWFTDTLPATNIIDLNSNGRYVAFFSCSSDLVKNDDNYQCDAFVHDTLTRKTERVSVASNGEEATAGKDKMLYLNDISISADGRYVAFTSEAINLVKGDTNKFDDIFVHDRLTHKTERVSVSTTSVQANFSSLNPSISANGRYVTFTSDANNLVVNDKNKKSDAFIHDRLKHSRHSAPLFIIL